MDPFEQRAADAWRKAIGESEAFQKEGEQWKIRLGLIAGEKGILLDLEGGGCRSATALSSEETVARADAVFSASEETWRALIEGRENMVGAVMGGKVQLPKGDLLSLASHAGAAKALLDAARKAGVLSGSA